MLSPLIHTSPFPILVRFNVTASSPIGVANVVWVTGQVIQSFSEYFIALKAGHFTQDYELIVLVYLVPSKGDICQIVDICPFNTVRSFLPVYPIPFSK